MTTQYAAEQLSQVEEDGETSIEVDSPEQAQPHLADTSPAADSSLGDQPGTDEGQSSDQECGEYDHRGDQPRWANRPVVGRLVAWWCRWRRAT